MKPLVSILTPTYNRRQFIPQYLKYVRAQNYKGPIEILIADDSDISIKDLVENDTRIKYYYFDKKKPLGFKRNLLANEAQGDILVHMDDDDFYPPSRIEHAVNSLLASDKAIAGCSICFFYNVMTDKITVSGPFANNHGTAGTFAYFRECLKDHSFQDEALAQEEPHFTKNFTSPMVQLDPLRTMLVIQHTKNTWDKSKTSSRPTEVKLKEFIHSIEDRRFYKSLKKQS